MEKRFSDDQMLAILKKGEAYGNMTIKMNLLSRKWRSFWGQVTYF